MHGMTNDLPAESHNESVAVRAAKAPEPSLGARMVFGRLIPGENLYEEDGFEADDAGEVRRVISD